MNLTLRSSIRTAGFTAMALALAAFTFAARADSVSFTGQFAQDDELFAAFFDLSTGGTVTAQTLSYGGGVNLAGNPVAAGGFVPQLSLFETTLGLVANVKGHNGCGSPGAGNADPVSGFCWDAGFNLSLPAGHFVLVLSQDGNDPGLSLADAFSQAGQADYTGQLSGMPPGTMFVDLATYQLRASHWAFDLTLPAGTSVVPEPATAALVLAGLGLATGVLRRHAKAPAVRRRRATAAA